jgi:pyruvate,orthophosphate dikinase
LDHRNILEKHFHDLQDLEFTIESGKLYMLQTGTGKRTAQAAIRITVKMVADEAEQQNRLKEKIILVRIETSPEDIHDLNAALGILTSLGGMMSHAAVVLGVWAKTALRVVELCILITKNK